MIHETNNHLGDINNIVIQKENGVNLISKNTISSSEFVSIPLNNEPIDHGKGDTNIEIQKITDNYNLVIDKLSKKDDPVEFMNKSLVNKFYFASLTIIGLYAVFRMIKLTR
jgi:hypothetical protein